MEGVQENYKQEQFSTEKNSVSRDLLSKFMNGSHFPLKFIHAAENVKTEEEEEENGGVEIELSLGLSLNGKFGVDLKRGKEKIVRSSSIASFMMVSGDDGKDSRAIVVPVAGHAPLMRACSLPAEAEEEWRKRMEMQMERRMEAKRKRMERKNVVRAVKEKVDVVENGNGSSVIGGYAQGQYGNGLASSSQGSMGSQGSGSSGITDSESQPARGMSKSSEERSPSSVQPLQEQCEQRPVTTPGMMKSAGAGDKEVKSTKELFRNPMLDMPCVSTRGDGPNGRKIEGFLYRYQKGQEVKIVCVCHGSFFSPAEFVRHAGGGDVTHPLKHIVVDPSPLL